MIAHNNDRDRDIFQIAPGTGPQSLWLAYQAHLANEIWNDGTAHWNRRASRRKLRVAAARSTDGRTVPGDRAVILRCTAKSRPHYDPRSTLYNTDGQIFSDAGVPVVLFMENYDINRTGYHDTTTRWRTSTWITARRWRRSRSSPSHKPRPRAKDSGPRMPMSKPGFAEVERELRGSSDAVDVTFHVKGIGAAAP